MVVFTDRGEWTLPTILRRQAERFPDRPFLAFALGGRELTYGEADAQSDAVAAALHEMGVGFGDHLLLMLGNRAEFVLSWFGANKIGAVEVPVNTEYRGYFLEHLVNTSGASVMVVEAEALPQVLESGPRMPGLRSLVVVGDAPAMGDSGLAIRHFSDLLRPAAPPRVEVAPWDIAGIHFTSGTTGPAKGALMTHAHQHLLGEKGRLMFDLGPDDVVLTYLPLFHINAQVHAVYAALLVGASVNLKPRFSASRWAQDVRETGATATTLLGVMMPFIMEQPAGSDDSDTRLRSVCALPFTMPMSEEFRQRFGVERIVSTTGNTEVGSISVFDPASPDGSCGLPDTTWYDIRLVDPETDEPVPVGEVGELIVRPRVPWIMTQGYVGMPEATLAAFRNLWFHTGDALRQDAEGYLYFVDRIKDRIRKRGHNIPSGDVEHVLCQHAAVAEAAIVAVPSEIVGGEDEIKACLVLHEGAAADAAEIARWCEERLPGFAVPRYVEFRESLPKTPTQKVRKNVLREEGVTAATVDTGPSRPSRSPVPS